MHELFNAITKGKMGKNKIHGLKLISFKNVKYC
jgi:hypothetical protein